MGPHAHLFRTSFLVLYLEVALLRWVGAYVPFASFFTHHVLLGALLGVCLGFFLTGRDERLLRAAPLLLVATLAAAAGFHLLHGEGLLAVRVDDPARPQRLFFGTIWPSAQPRRMALPIEGTLSVIFIGCALVFAGLGQRLGALFDAAPRRIAAYAVHLGGCVLGTAAFAALAATGLPPLAWFVPALALLAWEVRPRVRGWIALGAAAALVLALHPARDGWRRTWSPYNRVDFEPVAGLVFVNGIGHQQIADRGRAGEAYALPHLLRAAAGEEPARRVLVIGAGTGNDVAIALTHGALHVDAVEIDPVLADLGRRHHPDRPYDDPRVTLHVGDGRAFLERTGATYDLVLYGLVDSLTLHSSYASVRLESYLFTREALRSAHARLAPGGRLVITNYLRSGWLVARLTRLIEQEFGAPALVYTLPQRARIEPDAPPDDALTVLVSGPPAPAFDLLGAAMIPSLVGASTGPLPSDDWPYPYLRARAVPAQNLRTLGLLLAASLALLAVLRVPIGRGLDRHFLFLGTGFALIQTTSVARLAALLGTTWQVQAAVVGGVLATSLLGTLVPARWPGLRARPLYLGLAACLALAGTVETTALLGLPAMTRALAGGALLFAPLLCSGAIFAIGLRRCDAPHRALGSNTVGVLLGIALETLSVVTGLRGMVVVIAAAYLLSFPRRA